MDESKADLKRYMSSPISRLVPDELILWRKKESMRDFPQMARLIEAYISAIRPSVERKMKRESEREWWRLTFAAMEAVGQELNRIHSLGRTERVNPSDFVKVRESIEAMIEQIGSPSEHLASAEQITREVSSLVGPHPRL